MNNLPANLPDTPQVVGTIHSPGSLRRALRLKPGAVDYLELRVDHFANDLHPLRSAVAKLPAPCIVTVRHDREGGAARLTFPERAALYRDFLRYAAFIDVELRSLGKLRAVCEEARAAGVGLIGSHHDFHRTPALGKMRAACDRAVASGAAVFKLAAHARTVEELGRLLALLAERSPGSTVRRSALRTQIPLAVMGMGPLGKISRLLFASTGSVLNYGYLDEPQVSGQWEATLLKKRLQELTT